MEIFYKKERRLRRSRQLICILMICVDMFSFRNILEAAIEVNDVGYSGDGAAEHFFLQTGGNANEIHSIFQTETVIKNILQLRTEIVICYRWK